MKKRIAVFANGWSDEYVQTVLKGMRECAEENKVDVCVFVDFSANASPTEDEGECNIVKLPKFSDFDGVMLLANTFNVRTALDNIQREIYRSGLPAVSLEYEIKDIDYMGTENYNGMYELTSHMIEVHNAKDILFVGGQPTHEEGIMRKKAVEEAMKAHGLSLTEDHVVYGLFSDIVVQGEVQKWIDGRDGKLPDVIICANDIMAMGACFWLQKNGYKVPEDVAVTGYDCVKSARLCYPSITSVARDWDRLGYNGLQHLLNKMKGIAVEKHISMKSKFAVAESCGCKADNLRSQRESISFSSYGRRREMSDFESHNRVLLMYTKSILSYEELQTACRQYYIRNHEYEGPDFAICTEPDFWDEKMYGVSLRREGFSKKMSMICCMKNGEALDCVGVLTETRIPFYESDEKGHIFLFAPLHDSANGNIIGYAVFGDGESIIDNGILYSWTRHLNQTLIQARQTIHLAELNKRLEQLSVTDALTGIYNRMGYEKFALPYLEECRRNHKHGVMLFADINHMKTINDKYGHLQGDTAICAVASALKKALPKDWIVVRYGGDEFLAAGSCGHRDEVHTFETLVKEELSKEIYKREITFELSVSVGTVWVDDDITLSLEECFKKADQSMYMMKEISHNN